MRHGQPESGTAGPQQVSRLAFRYWLRPRFGAGRRALDPASRWPEVGRLGRGSWRLFWCLVGLLMAGRALTRPVPWLWLTAAGVCFMLARGALDRILEVCGVQRQGSEPFADEHGIHLGNLHERCVDWWEIESIHQSRRLWTVHYRGGSFEFDAVAYRNDGLRRAVLNVMRARRFGWLLPDEPLPWEGEPTDASISLTGMDGDEDAERGLSRVDG